MEHPARTVPTSLLPSSGHMPPGSRVRLVDGVMDLPEVRVGSRREATVPLGNAESLKRLRERTEDRKPQTDPVRGMSHKSSDCLYAM